MNKNIIKYPGEVSAIMGYDFQYSIFATEIYDALLNEDSHVEWIEFASKNAGKLDDVLIAITDSILAFQVKDITSSTFSYASLTAFDEKSILNGMFIGWKKLRADYPNKRIDARFITTQSASSNDKIESYKGKTKPSFQDFLTNFWNSIREGKYTLSNLPKGWGKVLDELVQKTKSSTSEILDFIKSTNFIFNYSQPKHFDSKIERQRRIDIEDLTAGIFQAVAKKGNCRFTKREFLENFNLVKRYESYYTHSFFVDSQHYQTISDTENQLDEVLNRQASGYIALVGNAGSGKSTLLTKWLQQGNYRVLKYYAYVNTDMAYEYGFRGEAKTFLHDLLVQIRQAKYSLQDRLPTEDIIDLQKHFIDELNKLSREEGKTIIVVDGLDHIEREQDVTKSLIGILPLPETIPNNIYFILGSRTIENLDKLNPRIKEKIKNENTAIIINPLSKVKVFALLQSYKITLSEDLLERLYVNTKGHPLFLRYTIEELTKNVSNDLSGIIEQRIFSGDIYMEYKVFWEKIKAQDEFIEILGIIARFRHSFFDIELIKAFPKLNRGNQHETNKLFENYFYKLGNIWQFFHSSFKEFLIEETAKDILTGKFDKEIDKEFHFKIYDAIKNVQGEYKWNTIFHLSKAEDYPKITSLISQKYFRTQWFEFRNHKLIKEDIQLAIQACSNQKEIYCLFICFLALFEFKQRLNLFNPRDYFTTLHDLGKITLANSFVYDNVELLVESDVALNYSLSLYKKGYTELAYDIFLRATPTYLLNQSKTVNARRYDRESFREIDELNIVSTWAKVASLFKPFQEVLEQIESIKVEKQLNEESSRDLFSETFSEILALCIELKDWAKLEQLESSFVKNMNPEDAFYFYFEIVSTLPNENTYYEYCLTVLSTWVTTTDNRINKRLGAIHILRRDIEKTKEVFKTLLRPDKIKKDEYSLRIDSYLSYIFEYSRFFYITSKEFSTSPSSFLPSNDKPTKIAFYHAFAELGKSYAYLFHDYKDAAFGYYSNIEHFLNLFHYSVTDYEYEYSVSESKPLLINSILEFSTKLSRDVFVEILERLGKEWELNKRFWRTGQIQEVIDWVIESKLNNDWCSSQLKKIDLNYLDHGYVDTRIEIAVMQIKLWSKLGHIDMAESIFSHIMNISLDVRGEKDYQLDYIVDWLGLLNSDMSEELEYYLSRVNGLREKVNSASHTPAKGLLEQSLKYGNGFNIFKYLLFEGLVTFNDSIELLLSHLLSSSKKHKDLILDLFTKVVLAYDNNHYARHVFLNTLLSNQAQLTSDELSKLVREVSIYSISEHKNDYLFRIQEYALSNGINPSIIGITERIQKKEKYSSDSPKDILTLKDGSKFDPDTLLEKISTIDELKNTQEQAEYNYSFTWENLYRKVFKQSTTEEILEFSKHKLKEPREVSWITKALISASKNELAKQILYQAIDNGNKHGWVQFVDGGSKIVPYEILHQIEKGENFKNKILSDFCNSMSAFDIQTLESLLNDAPKIWTFFSENLNYDKLYLEIKEYRTELLKTHVIDFNTPGIKGDLNNDALLLELIYFLFTFPSDFSHSLHQTLLDQYTTDKTLIKNLVKRLFKDQFYSKYLKLLTILNTKHDDIVLENQEQITKLLNHERYDISRLAYNLLDSSKVNPDQFLKVSINELPVTYKMELKYTPSIFNSKDIEIDHIDKKGFLKETEDPLVYVRLYISEIKMLSDQVGIPVLNIAHRIISLGKTLEFPDWCNSISEEEIRLIYSARFDLEISYKRPRIQYVWDGFMKVLKEFWELDLIDSSFADMLANEFDELAYLVNVKPKPIYIETILDERSGDAPSARKGWCNQINEEYLEKVLSHRITGNSLILAEHSIIRGMGWGLSEEIRQSFIDPTPQIDYGPARQLIFNLTSEFNIKDYINLHDRGLTVYNALLTINKKRNWLAINPWLCEELGLVFNPEQGNFRWDDEQGNKIVESIFWQMHSTDNYSKNHHSESGYGWIVILYETGHELFKSFLGNRNLFQHKKVSRFMEYNSTRHKEELEEAFSCHLTEKIIF